jgi:hypothetical protein
MYGGDEPSTPSPPVRSQVQQQREVYVGADLPPRSTSTRKKSKEPSPSTTIPTIVTPKPQNHAPPLTSTEHSRSFSVTGDDIEAAYDAINDYKASTNESKEYETSSPDSLFGLSTIRESIDTDDIVFGVGSSKQQTDEEIDEIDFDNCFNKYKHQQQNQTKIIEEKQIKKSAPSTPVNQQSPKKHEPKSARHSKEQKRTAPIPTDDIRTPTVSIPTPQLNTTPTPTVIITTSKQTETISDNFDDPNESVDKDVDEILGKLEVSIYPSLIHAHIHTDTYTHVYLLTKSSVLLLLLLFAKYLFLIF